MVAAIATEVATTTTVVQIAPENRRSYVRVPNSLNPGGLSTTNRTAVPTISYLRHD